MIRHLTASAAAFDSDGRLLLVHHNRYGCWVVPGGHVEPDESPDFTAMREVLEETGVEIEIVSATDAPDLPGQTQLAAPFIVAAIPHPGKPERGEGPHIHIDLMYVATVKSAAIRVLENEVSGVAFFTLDEIDQMADVREDVPGLARAARHQKGNLL